MNEHDENTDALGERLAGLTQWSGPGNEVWRGALESSQRTAGGRVMEVLRTPIRRAMPVVVLSVLALIVAVGALLPSLGKARSSVRSGAPQAAPEYPAKDLKPDNALNLAFDSIRDPSGSSTVSSSFDSSRVRRSDAAPAYGYTGVFEFFSRGLDSSAPTDPSSTVPIPSRITGDLISAPRSTAPPPKPAPSDRQVVRKATMELKTPDVRAAFLKAGMVVNQALGEFIEASTLTGEGNATSGSLTLRVAAERLSDVLNQLRALGTVASENATGEDVTSAAVDLEARLRNEQRIETELLELVDKRQDAPLKELLELRDELGKVREHIEQLTAQRERLSRLVSLATVLVLIRADATPVVSPVKPPPTIADYFIEHVTAAWDSGVRGLIQTIAWLVNLAVGGLVWWVVLAACLVGVRGLLRRNAANAAKEPAPAA